MAVVWVAGRVDGSTGEGFARGIFGDCANSDMESATLATAMNRIGALLCIWFVRRAARADVMLVAETACCEQVYRERAMTVQLHSRDISSDRAG